MRGIKFTNKQPINLTKSLNAIYESVESSVKERLMDIVTPGVILGSGTGSEDPLRIKEKIDMNNVIGLQVTPGAVFFGYKTGDWPENIETNYSSDQYETAGERVYIAVDTDVSFGTLTFSPTGTYYIYIGYKREQDNYSVVSEDSVNIFPKIKDNYVIYATTSQTTTNSGDIYLGEYSQGTFNFSGKQYSSFRDKSFYDVPTNSQRDSHCDGISVSVPSDYDFLGVHSASLINNNEKIRILFKISGSDRSFYIDGMRFTGDDITTKTLENGEFFGFIEIPMQTNSAPTETNIYLKKISNNQVQIVHDNSDQMDSAIKIYSFNAGQVNNNNGLTDNRLYVRGLINSETIQMRSIDADRLKEATITAAELAPNSVETEKIKDSAVTTDKIVNNAITTDKINNSAITTDKINDSAVTNYKIANYSIERNKLNFSHPEKIRLFVQGTLESSTLPVAKILIDRECYVKSIAIYCDTAPAGGDLILDLKYNGASILVDTTTPIKIPGGQNGYVKINESGNSRANNGFVGQISSTNNILSEGKYIEFFVKEVGISTPGGDDLVITIDIEEMKDVNTKYNAY